VRHDPWSHAEKQDETDAGSNQGEKWHQAFLSEVKAIMVLLTVKSGRTTTKIRLGKSAQRTSEGMKIHL
jgi:hypothetical protein